jgi:hypothetical protein
LVSKEIGSMKQLVLRLAAVVVPVLVFAAAAAPMIRW